MLEVAAVEKSYPTPQGPQPVLKGASLAVAPGETLAVMGESGSGKSTLLHLVAGLDAPDRGEIRLEGVAVQALDDQARASLRRARMGLVFQQFHLVASFTVAENLTFQARLAGREDPAWTAALAERLGLASLLSRYPEQLSGGQQQRLAIGRALAGKPALLLADEPTGALDQENGDLVLDLALGLVRETGAALMMATHSARVAARLDRRLRLDHGVLSEDAAAPGTQSAAASLKKARGA
ncbi:MAG: ABC transporter ATP-binding protein [Pseudomonadota bacterium]